MLKLKICHKKRILLVIFSCSLYAFLILITSYKWKYELISCYEMVGNTLESLSETPVRKDLSVFFVETTCNGGQVILSARQACSVESAARINPHLDVYVLFPSPITNLNFSNQGYVRALLRYENVRLRHLEVKSLFENSPMIGGWAEAKAYLKSSSWPQSHASDLIRYAILWKYGGIYLDLDVILLQPFDKNDLDFSCAESQEDIAAGAISFSYGNYLADMAMEDLHTGFRGDIWGHNGPGTITRLLTKICRTDKVSEMIGKKCHGYSILPPEAYYPIYWKDWLEYFSEVNSSRVMESLSHSKGVHVWNSKSFGTGAYKGSSQPYSLLAQQNCPQVYDSIPSSVF